MRKIIIGIFILAGTMTGCVAQHINTMSTEARHDVFTETTCNDPMPAEQTELIIISSLKTRKPVDLLWSNTSEGTSDFMLLLNIDGQVNRIKGHVEEEKVGPSNSDNPEVGVGMRYFFSKRLCLGAGLHTVSVALPEDSVYLDREVNLAKGTSNVLQLVPVYGRRIIGRQLPLDAKRTFYEGINGFKAFLNDKEI